MKRLVFLTKSEEETRRLARDLARNLAANDCLALVGGFGSGKTTFVKGLAEGLSPRKKSYVCSPSFVILKIYPGRLPLYHFDLYRLNRSRDLEEIGLEEFVASGGVSVIEWADRCKEMLPKEALKVSFTPAGPTKRRIVFSATNALFKRLMEA